MKYKSIWGGWALYGVVFAFLQIYSRFHFYYIEQNQLFQFTGEYIRRKIGEPGGFAWLLGEFIVQFFALPYVGAALTAALLCGSGFLTYRILKRMAPQQNTFFLACLPMLGLLFIHFDFNYRIQGSVAYLLTLLFLDGCTRLSGQRLRLGVSLLLTPLLFWGGGAVAILFAICMALWELLKNGSKGYPALLLLLEALCLGGWSLQASLIGEVRFAFLPDAYYHPGLSGGKALYYAWIALPTAILLAFLQKNRPPLSTRRKVFEGSLQIALLGGIAWLGVGRYGDKQSAPMKEIDYYARTRQWDQIIRKCQGPLSNYLYICSLNRALAEKGELADRMFAFDQRGIQGVLVPWNKSAVVSTLLSDLYFTIGDIALSQEMAFESYVSTTGEGNPRMLQRLVQTNLIYGAYPVAEKYLDQLSHTFYYRQWAEQHRKFLYNDAAVANDPLLGQKQRNLPAGNPLFHTSRIVTDLQSLISTNPSNSIPIQYLGALCLASKDLGRFKNIVEKYYGTPALPVLPLSFQEAVITLSEKDPGYWKQFNVSESVRSRFLEYKKQILAHKNNPSALPGLMKRAYGDTYWFYFMFK